MVWHSTFIVIGISAAGLNKNVLEKNCGSFVIGTVYF